MKTEIFSFVFNRPDILSKQIECFKKFFIGEYNLNIVCDYRDEKYLDEFKEICKSEEVTFYEHKSQEGLGPSDYHGGCVSWAYQNCMKGKDGYALIVDHDMFLVEEFNLEQYMEHYDVAGCLQERGDVKYVWCGMVLLDLKSVEEYNFHFSPAVVRGEMLDSGGGTVELVENLRFKDTGVEYPDSFENIDLSTVDEGYGFELHLDGMFLHHRNACGWHNQYQVVENSRKKEVLNLMLDSFLGIEEDILIQEYQKFATTKSEINEHLPTLYALAKECDSIVELGVCHGKSSRALLASGTKLRSYDVWIEPKVLKLFEHAKSIGNDVEYIRENSVKTEIEDCDMLFIDTWHNYYQLRKELKLHSDKSKKWIVLHDTVSCASKGEDWQSWGNGKEIDYDQLCEDLDTEMIDHHGITSAVFEFLSLHPEWKVKQHYRNNNGLTILERNG